jgi:hypothetical protein
MQEWIGFIEYLRVQIYSRRYCLHDFRFSIALMISAREKGFVKYAETLPLKNL